MKKLFITFTAVFLVLAIGSGVFFYSQYSSTKYGDYSIGNFHRPYAGPTPLEQLHPGDEGWPTKKEKDDKATTYLMLMVVSIIVFIVLALISILVVFIAVKNEQPGTVSREEEKHASAQDDKEQRQ